MKTKHTFKYTFSFFLFFVLLFTNAQETSSKKIVLKDKEVKKVDSLKTPKSTSKTEFAKITNLENKKKTETNAIQKTVADTTKTKPKTDRYGLRLGLDLYKLTRGFYDKDYRGLEVVGDYRLTKRYFLAAELGVEDKTTEDTRLSFNTQGTYLKGGFDYNAYDNWLDMENILSIGLRYGFSTFNQELNNYRVYNTSQYFGETNSVPVNRKYNLLTASWIEVVAGIKAKVFNNVFVGFSLRLNTLVTNQKPDDFDNLYIPGFNRTYDGSFGVGFNYTITYFVPIFKKKVMPAVDPKKALEENKENKEVKKINDK